MWWPCPALTPSTLQTGMDSCCWIYCHISVACNIEAADVVRSSFLRRGMQDSAAQAWKPFVSALGDHITKLNIYSSFLEVCVAK